MTIRVYEETTPGSYSTFFLDGSLEAYDPIQITADGSLGEVVEKLLYIRSDAAGSFEDISVQAVSKVSPSKVDGVSTGFGAKIRVGATQPTEAEWEDVDYASQESLSDISSTSTYLPFWIRFECPAGASVNNFEDVVIRVRSVAI